MKTILFASLLALAFTDAAPLEKRDTVQGFDISHYQGTVNFNGAYSSGARFVIIKVGFCLTCREFRNIGQLELCGNCLTWKIGHGGDVVH